VKDLQVPFPKSYFSMLAKAESKHWWFRARNDLLLWTLRNKVEPFASFLEVGCGTGYVLEAVSRAHPNVNLFGAEFYEEGLAFAKSRTPTASFRQLDATIMDDYNCYDVIGAFDVIEHIADDERVLKNLATALTDNGALIVTVPQHRWLWSDADVQAGHQRRYSRIDLLKKIEKAGLSVVYVTSFVSLLVPLMWCVRVRKRNGGYESKSEFDIPDFLNQILLYVMRIEAGLLRLGLRLPIGGSLLVVAKK
jgi:trans-aconitate methyltransferase